MRKRTYQAYRQAQRPVFNHWFRGRKYETFTELLYAYDQYQEQNVISPLRAYLHSLLPRARSQFNDIRYSFLGAQPVIPPNFTEYFELKLIILPKVNCRETFSMAVKKSIFQNENISIYQVIFNLKS